MAFFRYFQDSREHERAYHQIRIAASQSVQTIGDSVLYDMAVLDSKSAALLQFISVVLAALTFSLSLVDRSTPYAQFIRAGILLFMALFAFSAWVDLRCLKSMGPARLVHMQSTQEYEDVILTEISARREKYLLALRITETTFLLLLPFVIFWMTTSFRTLQGAL